MSESTTPGASNAEFELRVQQAIQSAMYTTSQVVVVLIDLESSLSSQSNRTVQNSILVRLRGRVRESDTVTLLDQGQIGVLLRSVQSPKDINLIVTRLVGQLAEIARAEES